MIVSDLLRRQSVLVPLDAVDREHVVAALVEALPQSDSAAPRAAIRAAVLAREAAGSTGIGNGVAIPHARIPQLPRPAMSAGRAAPTPSPCRWCSFWPSRPRIPIPIFPYWQA